MLVGYLSQWIVAPNQIGIGSVQIDALTFSMGRDFGIDLFYKVTVDIKQGAATPKLYVLPQKGLKDIGLAAPGLPEQVHPNEAVMLMDAKGIAFVPEIRLCKI